jgi:NDP-sugar pyrophosphorylase family protein
VATLAARPIEDAGRYGTVRIDPTGAVLAFDEKAGEGPADINAGVYVLHRDAMAWAPPAPAFSLERDLFPALVAERRLRAVRFDAFFVDIGIPAAHAAIDRDPMPLLGDPV